MRSQFGEYFVCLMSPVDSPSAFQGQSTLHPSLELNYHLNIHDFLTGLKITFYLNFKY